MRSGITRRWLRGSLLITVLLVLLVEVMFLYSATRSYYNGVQQTMYRRFSSITGQLKMYTGETSQKTAASRSVALRRMVEQFSDKDKYEFMLLDSYGGVIASSSGTDAEGIVTRTDFEQAQDAVDGQGIAIYRTQSGEMVMAACCLVPYAAEDVAAMRLVTSLTLVEEQLKRTVVVALIMGAAVLAFTIMSGLYFVRSIVVPLGQVERTAAGIENARKGFATVRVVDADGKPVPGAKISVRQKTHDFGYGANIFMLDEFECEEKNRIYREKFAELFNLATVPFYWSDLEPEEGKPRFAKDSPKIYRRPAPDLCVEYCKEKGIEASRAYVSAVLSFPSSTASSYLEVELLDSDGSKAADVGVAYSLDYGTCTVVPLESLTGGSEKPERIERGGDAL